MTEKRTVKTKRRAILIGNANVGKSVVFKQLTGQYVTVANYPGTTVELAWGKARFKGEKFQVIDTPGINSLLPLSEDERVAQELLLTEEHTVIVQIADAKNLRRTLWLTVQLAELGIPMVLDLNIMDEAKARGMEINRQRLSEILGIEVIPTVATQNLGMEQLAEKIPECKKPTFKLEYDEKIEAAIERLLPYLPESHLSLRGIALLWLCGDRVVTEMLSEELDHQELKRIESIRSQLKEHFLEPVSRVLSQQRIARIHQILTEVVSKKEKQETSPAAWLGRMAMHPMWGLPILALVLFAVYEIVGIFGAGTVVGLVENGLFGKIINPFCTKLFSFVPVPLIRDFFVGEYGVITMGMTYALAIVLPVVGFFFLVFGILEDVGYLPRLAIMVDKFFRLMGLNGKAVLPMVLGLGCDTMATLTTRILESKKERILVTLLLALGVPCSAQLGVVLGMVSGISGFATAIWIGTVVLVMLLVGYLAAKAIPGEPSDFVLELPPIRVPQLANILIKTVARVQWYLKEAVPLFILGTLILFVAHKAGALEYIQKMTDPLVVGILGLPSKAAEAFVIGFLRRDYGAAGLFVMQKQGLLDPIQVVVSLVVITLFVPCIANFFMMVKERGMKAALYMVAFIFPFAFAVGGALNWALRFFKIAL